MRVGRAALTGVVVTATGLVSAPAAGAPIAIALRLPTPVTVQAGAGRFQIERDGHVRKLPDGHERRVARNEFPLGWTSGGFYAYRYRGHQLLLRSDTGSLDATVARWPTTYSYDHLTQNLYFIAHGMLMRALGALITPIASLPRLGLRAGKPDVMVAPLGPLVELLTNGRLMMLRTDGSLFAKTWLPDLHGGIASQVVLAPNGGAVAYTSTLRDTETVFLLRRGARAATALHTERVDLGGCERGVSLQWHGRWLLYGTSTGNAAVIDSARRRRTIELTPVLARLAGADGRFSVYWSGQPPQF